MDRNRFLTYDRGPRKFWERVLSRVMLTGENCIKVPVFGCQRCGECLLSHTAFICCQRCPKRLRNGPCGGTRDNGHCEVFPERFCVWYRIHNRARFLRRTVMLNNTERIHNWKLEKTSAWLNVFTRRIPPPALFIKRRRHES
jgi:hypothetical protein